MILAATASCSVFSGWGDLEGGCRGVCDGGGGGADSGNGGDAPADDVGVGLGLGVPCASATCTGGQGCCVPASGGTGACTSAASCGSGSLYLTCSTASQCASLGQDAVCCLDLGGSNTATCATWCGNGTILCDPTTDACPWRMSCIAAGSAVPGYPTCQ
jgi:hypothetical protein